MIKRAGKAALTKQNPILLPLWWQNRQLIRQIWQRSHQLHRYIQTKKPNTVMQRIKIAVPFINNPSNRR